MRLALLADLHSNLPALDACLAHARAQGADQFAILGDLVGYGPHPVEVVERCRALQREGATVLRGNHDAFPASAAQPNPNPTWGEVTMAWTREQLTAEQRDWLAQLPLTAQDGEVFLVHASADAPERWLYVEDERMAERSLDAATREPAVHYVFGGHVHVQSLYYRGTGRNLMRFDPRAGIAIPVGAHRQWVATVGSAGQPRDGNTRANYALFDTGARMLTFHRVAYDHLAVAEQMRAAGLPENLVSRMENGK